MRWIIPVLTLLLILVVSLSHFILTERTDLPLLFGYRDHAVFDLWSIHHLLAGIVIGKIVLFKFKKPVYLVCAVLIVALTWEGLELLMDYGSMGTEISTWKGGFEHWGNRLVGDPLMVTTGGWIARKNHQLWKYALIYCIVWFSINAISPNSMYIQHILLGG